jgi:benzoyl-CoA reductase/2-hydroxyglutaryl-CoA dehydratase subunit BcrC/BadD/HgdB
MNLKTSTALSLARFFANRKSLFHLLKFYEWWLKRKFSEPTLPQTSYQLTIKTVRELYSHSRPVIWSSLFFPCEFIHAIGAIPFYPEITIGLVAALGFSNIPLESAEKNWYSQDLCSYHRAGVGMSLLKLFPRPDCLVATTSICRGTAGFFRSLADIWKIPCFLIDVPYQTTPEANNYVKNQLSSITSHISSQLNCQFRWEDAFSLSNSTVKTIQQIEALRKRKNFAIQPPTKNLDYLPYYFQFLGSPVSKLFFEKFLFHLQKLEKSPTKFHRLVWLHLKPFYPNQLTALLNEYHFDVVYDEFASVFWKPLEPEKPFESLTNKIISSQNLTVPEKRIDRVLHWCDQFQADGVIQFNQWGCRQSQGMNFLLKNTLQQKGYPVLLLDGDHIDKKFYSEEQLRTRIEAFHEMLEG